MKRSKIDIKKLLMVLVPAAFLSFGGVANAQISGTAHDLNTSTTVTGTTEICIFCHTPHTTVPGAGAPLWNRSNAVATFDMYDTGNSPTMDMSVAATPQGVSMGCLSCHDGATAYNALLKTNNQTISTNPAMMTGSKAVGLSGDLTNDHPISVTYDTTQDPDFVALGTVQLSSLVRLFGSGNDQVECASCHDPHDNTTAQPFLRVANTGSQICLACHSK